MTMVTVTMLLTKQSCSTLMIRLPPEGFLLCTASRCLYLPAAALTYLLRMFLFVLQPPANVE